MNWNDLQKIISNNPAPPTLVEKRVEEWRQIHAPQFTGLRCCINSASLKKVGLNTHTDNEMLKVATSGGDCFCIYAILNELEGMAEMISGYAGGYTEILLTCRFPM